MMPKYQKSKANIPQSQAWKKLKKPGTKRNLEIIHEPG